jgi:hypothetical protein
MNRLYHYVGPADIKARVALCPAARFLGSGQVAGLVAATLKETAAVRTRPIHRRDVLRRPRRGGNQSTGFCPQPESWSAVATALDRADVPHPEWNFA